MFKKIEELYKNDSPYNKIKKKIFFAYVIIVSLLLVFNVLDLYIMMLIIVFATLWIMKKICEKELGVKLCFKLHRNNSEYEPLDKVICEKENEMFKRYLNDNNIYYYQILKCIMEHYRNLVKPKAISDNFWSIIAIAISVVLAFVTKDGFDFNSFERVLPYLIFFVAIVIVILVFIRQFSEIKTFFKGEDGMYERLEIIFSELYIESINEIEKLKINNLQVKKGFKKSNRNSSKNNKKRKKQKKK